RAVLQRPGHQPESGRRAQHRARGRWWLEPFDFDTCTARGAGDLGGAGLARGDFEQAGAADQGDQLAATHNRIVGSGCDDALLKAHLEAFWEITRGDVGDEVAVGVDVDDLALQAARPW